MSELKYLESVKLHNRKGLRSAKLENLGRINVVCGKNNAGKSTILECLTEDQHRSLGHVLREEDIEAMYAKAVSAVPWGDSRSLNKIFEHYLKEVFPAGTCLYQDEIAQYMECLMERQEHRFNGFKVPAVVVANFLKELLTWTCETVLVPAKRLLELDIAVHADQPISHNGSGILNFLFKAKNQARDSGDRMAYDRIRSAFEQISAGFRFEIFLNSGNSVGLKFAFEGGTWIGAEACGLGLQDLLVLLYWVIASPYSLILIEEPESHLHPDTQRRLALHLRDQSSKQYVLTTHSNIFLSPGLAEKVFFAEFNESVSVNNATSKAVVLNELGYSIADNLVSDLIILVEGPTDRPIIEEFLTKFGIFGQYNIKIWPLGGDIMGQVDLSVFSQSNRVMAVIDSDPGSGRVRVKFKQMCQELRIPVHQLERYAIENYFTLRVLREVFKEQIPLDIATIDPDRKLLNQINIDVKRCNGQLARLMTLDEIDATDLKQLAGWVKEIIGG